MELPPFTFADLRQIDADSPHYPLFWLLAAWNAGDQTSARLALRALLDQFGPGDHDYAVL